MRLGFIVTSVVACDRTPMRVMAAAHARDRGHLACPGLRRRA
jgi:hypothetical protein